MILLHVDDFLVCGNGSFKGVIKSIMKKYDIHKNIGGSFKYVGVNISQCNDYITMDQFDYCKNKEQNTLCTGLKLDLNAGVVTKVYQKKRVRFSRLDLKQKVKMVVFADASFGNLDNKINSSRGYVIFLST
ncbi:hypothetical protein ACHWQZ_G011996, partial [Mnemiopsis leidyi]